MDWRRGELQKQGTLKVSASGSSIYCYIDGGLTLTATDTTFTAGSVGFRTLDGTADFGKMIVTH